MSELEKDEKSKEILYEALVSEGDGFYNMVMAVASGFLGGTITFLWRIAPNPLPWTIWILSLGCGLLIACISLLLWVRDANMENTRAALKAKETEDWDKIEERVKKNYQKNRQMLHCLIGGIICIAFFAIINLAFSKGNRDLTMTDENRRIIHDGVHDPSALRPQSTSTPKIILPPSKPKSSPPSNPPGNTQK